MTVCSSKIISDQVVRSTVEAERTPPISQVSGCPGRSDQCGGCVRTACLMEEALVGAEANSDGCDRRSDVSNGLSA